MITKINMPFMYARRAMINTYYPKFDVSTGCLTTVNSSIMNEQLLEEAKISQDNATRPYINDEVIAFNHINYIKIEPCITGGVYWTSVYCLDVGGMVTRKFTSMLSD